MAVINDKNKLIPVESSVVGFIPIPLKAKLRAPKTHNFGTYRSRTGNCHGPTPKRKGTFVSRKRAAGPWS